MYHARFSAPVVRYPALALRARDASVVRLLNLSQMPIPAKLVFAASGRYQGVQAGLFDCKRAEVDRSADTILNTGAVHQRNEDRLVPWSEACVATQVVAEAAPLHKEAIPGARIRCGSMLARVR